MITELIDNLGRAWDQYRTTGNPAILADAIVLAEEAVRKMRAKLEDGPHD